MEREPSIESFLNIIKLQEAALIYYSNKKNYAGNIEKMPILKDRGEQARFALKQSEKIKNYEEELTKNLTDALKDAGVIDDLNLEGETPDETKNKINYFQNILNNLNINQKENE